jgi:Protein of unknown function (DUF2798)
LNDGRLSVRWFPWVFALLMGGAMTAVVTLVLTLALDVREWSAAERWLCRWLLAWATATPSIWWLAPRVRRIAARFVVPPQT